jgi:hypothetical protein
MRRRPASRLVDAARGAAPDRGNSGKDNVTVADGAVAAATRKRFRNLKCGARIQGGFTYCVSDNFKIICG